jgi:hypothetical protein
VEVGHRAHLVADLELTGIVFGFGVKLPEFSGGERHLAYFRRESLQQVPDGEGLPGPPERVRDPALV